MAKSCASLGGRPLGRVPELLFILSLLERRGFAARLFFAFFFFAVSTGSAHGLVSRRSRDSRATNRLWSGGLSIAAWTSRLLQIPGAIVCGMFGGKISALCPAVLAPWGPGRCVPTGGTPPPPDPLIDPRGSGEERLGITGWGPVRCEPSDGSPPLSVPIISPFGPGEERTGAIVCGIFSGKISALCPAVLAPWGPGRCVPTGGTPPPPDPLIDPRGSGEERLGITGWGPVRCEPSDGSPPLSVPIISPFGPGEERTGAIVCGIFSGKISALCPAVLAPWGPGRCVPTGGTPPPPDPLIDPRGSGEERLGITGWGPVRCEPSDGSPPLSVPIISPFGPGEERTGAIVCGIFSGKISALCPAVLALLRQFLGGLASPKSLSPEACSSKGDSAESDPKPSGGAGGRSATSLGRSRAARGCPSSVGCEATEGTRAWALWIRGCLDSQTSARSFHPVREKRCCQGVYWSKIHEYE